MQFHHIRSARFGMEHVDVLGKDRSAQLFLLQSGKSRVGDGRRFLQHGIEKIRSIPVKDLRTGLEKVKIEEIFPFNAVKQIAFGVKSILAPEV